MYEIERLTKVRDELYEKWADFEKGGWVYQAKDTWRAYRKADKVLQRAIRKEQVREYIAARNGV